MCVCVCIVYIKYSSRTRLLFSLIRSSYFYEFIPNTYMFVFICHCTFICEGNDEWSTKEAHCNNAITFTSQFNVRSVFTDSRRFTYIAHSTPQNVIYNQTNEKTALVLFPRLLGPIIHLNSLAFSFSCIFFPVCGAEKQYPCILLRCCFFTVHRSASLSLSLSQICIWILYWIEDVIAITILCIARIF